MIVYFDTSALVKLFSDEPGLTLVREAAEQAEFRGCHMIGYAEACAALARGGRARGLGPRAIQGLLADLERTWAELDVIEADWPLVRRAGDLAVELRLRGYDSVHLAAAEAIWTRVGGAAEFRFAVFDGALADAARTLGMDVLQE